MRAFADASIKQKLTFVPMLTSAVTVAVAGLLYLSIDVVALRREIQRELGSLTQVVGTSSSAALAFRDETAATQILASLAAKENIVAAFLYLSDGTLLTHYERRPGAARPLLERDAADGAPGGMLVETSPIVVGGQQVGTIRMFSDLTEVSARMRRAAGIGLLVVLVSLGVGFLVASRLQLDARVGIGAQCGRGRSAGDVGVVTAQRRPDPAGRRRLHRRRMARPVAGADRDAAGRVD
jgi:hypothetical protein